MSALWDSLLGKDSTDCNLVGLNASIESTVDVVFSNGAMSAISSSIYGTVVLVEGEMELVLDTGLPIGCATTTGVSSSSSS